MKYLLQSKVPNLDFLMETEHYYTDLSECDDVWNVIYEFAQELLYNWTARPQGFFDVTSAENFVFKSALEYVDNNTSSMIFTNSTLNENDAVIEQVEINISELIRDAINSEWSDCGSYSIVGKYIEECLMSFVKKGTWHLGIKTTQNTIIPYLTENGNLSKGIPILWFGIDIPETRWVLDPTDTEFNLDFWFLNADWECLEALVPDHGEVFEIWYLAECGYELPDIDSIRAKCPIEITKNDTPHTLKDKIESFTKKKFLTEN